MRRILAAGCALAIVAGASGGSWSELGPRPIGTGPLFTGRISAIACSRTNASLWYIAGADGGVWKTTNAGANWTPLTDMTATTATGALAVDPNNDNIIYVGTGDCNYANHSRPGFGVLKSTDGGQTWAQFGAGDFSGRSFSRLIVDPANTQTVYAAVVRAGGFPALAAAKGHPGATGPVGVYRSLDGGATWAQLTNGLPAEAATDVALDSTGLYAAIGHPFGSADNGIYVSTDGGDTWARVAGVGLPAIADMGRISLRSAPTQPGRLYALIAHAADAFGGLGSTVGGFRSDNGGATWTALTNLGSIQSTYGWYVNTVGVVPTNANIVFMGGVDLRRSTDAGLTWTTVTPPHVDQHALEFAAGGRVLAGDDGGLHSSVNQGGSWVDHNAGLGLIQFYAGLSVDPSDPELIIGGAQDNGTNVRSTPGTTWTNVLGGDGGWTLINPASHTRVFAEFQGSGNLYRSTTGALGSYSFVGSGIDTTDRNCFLPPYVFDPLSGNMLYGTHRVYRSTNGGASWTAISGDLTGGGPGSAIRSLGVAPTNSSVVYASTNDGRFLRSLSGGSVFSLMATDVAGWPRTMRQFLISPSNALNVYLASSAYTNNQVRRTFDGGVNWEVLDGDLPDIPVNVIAVDFRRAQPVIYAGCEAGVYRSINDGLTWRRFGAALPNAPVVDLILEAPRTRMIAATQGRGAWRIPVWLLGDMNCDNVMNNFDIDPFVLALTDAAAYAAAFPNCDVANADANDDGAINNFDIDPFVELLTQ